MTAMSLREKISLVIFLFVFFAIYGLEILLLARYLRDRIRRRAGRRMLHSRPALVFHALAAVGLICLLYAWFVEPYWIDVNVMTIRTAELRNAGFRIVQISDLHGDKKPRNEEETLCIVNGLKPDIIVATGDYLNHASALPRLQEMLRRLEAPLGKFAVTGNFETHRRSALAVLDGTGFRRLDRETVVVSKGADNIGIFGMDFVRSDRLRESIPHFPGDRFDILLYHTPDLIEDVNGLGIDLYLCGHTHGGQVVLPGYGALITFSKFGKKYESGLYQVGGTTLYVNRGLGLEPSPGPPVRFLARPEIAVFDIVPEQQ